MKRIVWVTSPSGCDVQVWADADGSIDVDVSDLAAPVPSRARTSPIDDAALADLLRRSRVA